MGEEGRRDMIAPSSFDHRATMFLLAWDFWTLLWRAPPKVDTRGVFLLMRLAVFGVTTSAKEPAEMGGFNSQWWAAKNLAL